MENVIDFSRVKAIRSLSDHDLWDILMYDCLSIIESCDGEVLKCVADKEQEVFKELNRRGNGQHQYILSEYRTVRQFTILNCKSDNKTIGVIL